jgi:hypothetical protein
VGLLVASANSDSRCRGMSAVSPWHCNRFKPNVLSYTIFPMRPITAKPLYSGVCSDRNNGNIAITMNSRVTIASCIVVVSTFNRDGNHRRSQYRASITRSPSHRSPRASHLSCIELRPIF